MRADRLLSLLLLLQTRERITALELAEKLEVSERTIYRDLDALSAAGIPVYAERGPGGGCALSENYRTNLIGLNETEIRTLFMAGAQSPLADLGLGKAMEDALLKLFAALPSSHRRDAERARQRIYLDAAGWNYSAEDVPHLRILQEAIWQERRLCLIYQRNDSEWAERVVLPYGLVAKASIWYLVAATPTNELRVFRVSRIQRAILLDEAFNYPADFDLASYWLDWCAEFKASFPRYPVTIRVAPAGLPLLPQMLGESMRALIEKAAPPDAEGWLTIPLSFENLEGARGRLLGFGNLVEVIEPLELRNSLIELATSVVDFYSRKPVTT